MKFESGGFSEKELLDAAPLALSFVGDAVHTLMVRKEKFAVSPYDNNELHKLSSALCCAGAQADKAKILETLLTENESAIYRKAKNAKVNSLPKNAGLYEYKVATAFEAVIGYLFLSGQTDRLNELMDAIYNN